MIFIFLYYEKIANYQTTTKQLSNIQLSNMSFSEDFQNAGADTNTWDEEPNHELAEPTTEYGEVMSAMNSPDTESDSDNSEWSAGTTPVESWEKQADAESEIEESEKESEKESDERI